MDTNVDINNVNKISGIFNFFPSWTSAFITILHNIFTFQIILLLIR